MRTFIALPAGFLSSVALATAAGLSATRVLTRLAARRAPALGRFVTVDGVRLHVCNEGEGPTVLLLHGAKGSVYDHELELAPLLRSRYRVITVDRPGSGYSARVPSDGRGAASALAQPRDSGSPFVQAEVLHGLLRELEAAPAVVLGHSAGAPVALALALRHPEDVAALVTAAGYTHAARHHGTPLARLLRARLLGRLFRAAFLAPAVALVGPLVLRRVAAPERAPREYARVALALNYDPTRAAGDAEDVAAVERDLRRLVAEYPRVSRPLIAVHGDRDAIVWPQQSERLVEAVAGAELRVVPGAGHLLPVTRAAELAAAVDDVARRLADPVAGDIADRVARDIADRVAGDIADRVARDIADRSTPPA